MAIYINGERTDMTYLQAKKYLAEQEKKKARTTRTTKKPTEKDSD